MNGLSPTNKQKGKSKRPKAEKSNTVTAPPLQKQQSIPKQIQETLEMVGNAKSSVERALKTNF